MVSAQTLPDVSQAGDLIDVPRSDGNVQVVRDGEPIGVIGLPEGSNLDMISDEDLRRLSGPLIDPYPPRVDPPPTGYPDQRGENERPVVTDPVEVTPPGSNVETLPIEEPNPGDSIFTSNAENNDRMARRQYEASNGKLANPDDLKTPGREPFGEWVHPDQTRTSGEGGSGPILPGYEYQEQVTGIPTGIELLVDGTLFDGVDHGRGVLIDAKDYDPARRETAPQPVIDSMNDKLVADLEAQARIAQGRGYTLEVVVSTEAGAQEIRQLITRNALQGIRVVFRPKV